MTVQLVTVLADIATIFVVGMIVGATIRGKVGK